MTSKATYYRNQMKRKDPEKYREYLNKQAIATKRRRDQLKEELSKGKPSKKALGLQQRQLEQNRARQRNYMERKKKEATNKGKKNDVKIKVKLSFKTPKSTHSNINTRSSIETLRAYWREKKQEERKRLRKSHPQKLRRIREKDRERKRRQRAQRVATKEATTPLGYRSIHTKRNDTTKARRALPKSPDKFASVVSGLIENASPRKSVALKRQGLTAKSPMAISPKVQEIANNMKRQREGREALKQFVRASIKCATQIQISKQFKLSHGTVRRALGNRNMCPELRQKVKDFCLRDDISRPLPLKRYATKHGPGRHMQMSLRAAHQLFESENPGAKLSYSRFTFMRPKNVRLLSKVHHEVCPCVYCLNVKYKLLVINRAIDATKTTNAKKMPDEFSFVDSLLCPKSDALHFQNSQCVMGTCIRCGDYGEHLRNTYSDVIDASDALYTWLHWEREEASEASGGKSRRVLKTKQGSIKVLIEELVKDVEKPVQGVSFVKHLFTARWQHRQFAQLKNILPETWGLMIMDFGKIRRVFYQDEIKSAYYGQRQITMHPVVTYYKKNNTLVRDSLIFLSDDISHDYHAVEHFIQLASDHLSKQLKVTHEVIWSDGCQSQYKGRGTFADLSLSSVSRERNYFGSEHGKGKGDGEIGVVNRAVDRAILGRKVVINSARDMWQWCSHNLASDEVYSKRRFVYVGPNEIKRDRPRTEITTVKGSRSFHQLQVAAPYRLKARRLSCFCPSCLNGEHHACDNAEYTGGRFQVKNLQMKRTKQEETDETDVAQVAETEDCTSNETTTCTRSGENASTTHPDDRQTLKKGDFIAVKPHGRRGTCDWYLAKVLCVTDDAMRRSDLPDEVRDILHVACCRRRILATKE